MNIKAFLRSIIKREEFRNKPLKVIYNVLKWQILSRFRDKVRYDWHSNLIVECSWAESGKYRHAQFHQNSLIKITSDFKNSESSQNNIYQKRDN